MFRLILVLCSSVSRLVELSASPFYKNFLFRQSVLASSLMLVSASVVAAALSIAKHSSSDVVFAESSVSLGLSAFSVSRWLMIV